MTLLRIGDPGAETDAVPTGPRVWLQPGAATELGIRGPGHRRQTVLAPR